MSIQCPVEEFDCGNGNCVDSEYHCDGDNDCGNGRDEADCNRVPIECPSGHWRCPHFELCIRDHWLCDGEEDCPDGSDEVNCTRVSGCRGFRCRFRSNYTETRNVQRVSFNLKQLPSFLLFSILMLQL